MTIIPHDESPRDRATMAAMRAALALSPAPTISVEDRPAFDDFLSAIPVPATVVTSPAEVGGVPGWWCRPPDAAEGRAILFLHGGGYVMGSAGAYRGFAGELARRSGVSTFVADYALAPEHPFPAAFDDARRALEALSAQGQVAIAGDSAGGGLALSLVLPSGQADARTIAAAVFSPWTDPTLSGASIVSRASRDPLLVRKSLANAVKLYLGRADRSDPRVNTLAGCFVDIPPIRIDVGNDELLLDDSLRFRERALRAGRSCEVHVWDGMLHVFPWNFAVLDAGAEALNGAAAFLREAFETDPSAGRSV